MFSPERLVEARKRALWEGEPMSITRLARLIGSDRSLVSGWENGRNAPNVASLTKIADALGCSLDDLVVRAVPAPATAA